MLITTGLFGILVIFSCFCGCELIPYCACLIFDLNILLNYLTAAITLFVAELIILYFENKFICKHDEINLIYKLSTFLHSSSYKVYWDNCQREIKLYKYVSKTYSFTSKKTILNPYLFLKSHLLER